MNDKFKFILKVTGLHMFTYIFCGIIFSTLFNYDSLFAIQGVEGFMKEFGGTSTLLGPLVQVIRGLLFGCVLLLFKDEFCDKKYGWLKLWGIIAIIGIINTPAPAPFSIEGVVYSELPLEFHIKGAPEILMQTLMFSYLIAKPSSNKKNIFIEQNKTSFTAAIMAMVMFSVSGIILALIYDVDIATSIGDVGAFGIMFIAVVTVFFVSKFYSRITEKVKKVMVIPVLYFVLAVLPYMYNLITGSPFNTCLTLFVNVVPTIIIYLYLKINNKNEKDCKEESKSL